MKKKLMMLVLAMFILAPCLALAAIPGSGKMSAGVLGGQGIGMTMTVSDDESFNVTLVIPDDQLAALKAKNIEPAFRICYSVAVFKDGAWVTVGKKKYADHVVNKTSIVGNKMTATIAFPQEAKDAGSEFVWLRFWGDNTSVTDEAQYKKIGAAEKWLWIMQGQYYRAASNGDPGYEVIYETNASKQGNPGSFNVVPAKDNGKGYDLRK